MMLYAYCVVDQPVQTAELSAGLSGNKVEAIERNNLFALVSEFEGDTVGVKRENVMKHDEVVRGVLDRTTPLPFRFGTLATKLQIENFLDARDNILRSKLNTVRDCVEMSVKVIWTPETTNSRELEPLESDLGQGAAFLRAKRREILGDEALFGAAQELKSWLHGRVSQFIREEEVSVRPSQKLVLSASHLVEKRQIVNYREAIKTAVEGRADLRFLTSGPWAPYSFANIDLEFKT